MKRLYILLLLLAGVLNAQVPNTATFTLQDVINEVNPTSNTLQSCFQNATGTFDPIYEGAKDRLSNFRNYQDAATLYDHIFSQTGFSTSLLACDYTGVDGQFLRANTNILVVGTLLYTDSSLSVPFNGNFLWYLKDNNKAYKINAFGSIEEIVNCSQDPPAIYSYTFFQEGFNSSSESCNGIYDYQNGDLTHSLYSQASALSVGSNLYSNTNVTTAYNGGGLWYTSPTTWVSYKVAFTGTITEISDCNAPPSYEAETTAYMTALGIPNDATVYYSGTPEARTGAQHWTYVDTFIKAEKTAGIWGTFPVYAFLGGTAARCSINMVNPAQNAITWYGSGVFNQFGFTGNGTDAYGVTGFVPRVRLNNASYSINTVIGSNNNELKADSSVFGVYGGGSDKWISFQPKDALGRIIVKFSQNNNGFSTNNADARGIYITTKNSLTEVKLYKNNNLLVTWNSGGLLPENEVIIGAFAINGGGIFGSSYINQTIRAVTFKDSLTATQVTAHTNNLDALYASFGTKTW